MGYDHEKHISVHAYMPHLVSIDDFYPRPFVFTCCVPFSYNPPLPLLFHNHAFDIYLSALNPFFPVDWIFIHYA